MRLFGLILCLLGLIYSSTGDTIDGCPPADPNCHPSCIEYTSDHCRYCRCSSSSHGDSSFGSHDWSSGSSSDQSWDTSVSGEDWASNVASNSDVWKNGGDSDAGSYHENEANVQYVIVEKSPDAYEHDNGVVPGPGPFMGGGGGRPMPGPMSVPSPYSSQSSSHRAHSAFSPGSFSSSVNSEYSSSSVIHVPLISPGVPRYCVRCPILSCPSTCERVDEYGCRSCPCAPSRFQTMPINRDCSRARHQVSCTAIEVCKRSCEEGYRIGPKDDDGCETCVCIRHAIPRTTPKPKERGCPATLSCMLKCTEGYILGDNKEDGCPSCKCLPKSSSGNHHSSSSSNNNNNNNNGNNENSHGTDNLGNNGNNNGHNTNNNENIGNGNGHSGNGFNKNGGSSTGSGDLYSGVSNGVGHGQCEPPMCLDGHMSVGEAMKIGESSAGTGAMDGGGMTSSGGMTSNGGMTSSGSGSSSGCSGPFCASVGGMGGAMSGGSGAMSGGGGMMGGGGGMMGGGGGMMGGGGGAMHGGGGMMMGGGGGGMAGGSGGSGGKPFSPFAAAMSGAGPGMGLPGRGGLPNAHGDQSSAVHSSSSTKDCIGPECSAKNGMHHKDCAQLLHCMMTCDSYMLGNIDQTGCQACSCQ